jgi:hypothetical protein
MKFWDTVLEAQEGRKEGKGFRPFTSWAKIRR